MLKEKGFCKGILDQYKAPKIVDPASKNVVPFASEIQRRYIRRLALHDVAERHELLESIFPNDKRVTELLKKEKERIIKLNAIFPMAEAAYDATVDMMKKRDYMSLKNVSNMISFIKNSMKLLNVEIRTAESW